MAINTIADAFAEEAGKRIQVVDGVADYVASIDRLTTIVLKRLVAINLEAAKKGRLKVSLKESPTEKGRGAEEKQQKT